MAFRADSDKLYTPKNGKFLKLTELIAKFDPVMQNHLDLAMRRDISDHYCGKNIQNELINLLAEKVNEVIIDRVIKAKYYSIIADCTPDVARKEQLSFRVRIVDISGVRVEITEYFLGFFNVHDSTSLGLTEALLGILSKHGLEIRDCRGQGYDNGSNMKGKKIGVQKRLLDINPLALYMPCGCHSLNLVLCDAAKSSIKSVNLFGVLQRLFTLFSASVNRWEILTNHVKSLSLKKLSDTRWEARVSSVKAVRYQIADVHDALITLSETDSDVEPEAMALVKHLRDFSFQISLIVWYDVLFQINVTRKLLQTEDISIAECAEMLNKCYDFLVEYRKNGFRQAIIAAKELAEKLQIEPKIEPLKRIKRVKRRFDETAEDEPIICAEKKFEIEFFNTLVDTGLMSIKERFEQLSDYSKTWRFLFNLKSLPKKEKLIECCINLQNKLAVNSVSDIDGTLLCDELISIKAFLDTTNKILPIDTLNFIKKQDLQELYPNVWISMRICLTIPVTVASGERSFSRLKLIENFLRSTMSQDRLSSLGTLSIENEIAENLDISMLIKEFANKKARKVDFGYV